MSGLLYKNCPCPFDPECDCSYADAFTPERRAKCARMTWEEAFGGLAYQCEPDAAEPESETP